ncbi:hypothetical protein KAJ83_01590 [Marivibrio halodurans]|uniref:Capsid assembly protein n=1 Tax=Marivibrio halodurans TaxID=2039722 RepID=A0A8J7RWH4_9PROT|nr:hypothetical protein [Marivibrio halodurans]MBP5855685.1 hypothetical protein [Marivibrio halodurans]
MAENDNRGGDAAAQTPEKGTPEYNEMMARRYESGFRDGESSSTADQMDEISQEGKPQKPDNVPDKFWNGEKGEVDVENLLKSYQELEKGTSGGGQESQEGSDGGDQEQRSSSEDGENDGSEGGDQGVKNVIENAGLDWSEITGKIDKNGTLDDEDFDALEDAGIPRWMAEEHIQMREASKQMAQRRSADYAGGQEVLNRMLERAANELPQSEIEKYNGLLNSKDWRIAIDAMKSRFGADGNASGGDEPSLMEGDNSSETESGFTSQQEMIDAMSKRDEKGRRLYDIDPQYKKKVRRKVAMSNFM